MFAEAAPQTPDLDRKMALSRLKQRLFAREAAVTLGRYHLLERVGRGGMGLVWGAWDPKLERRVAIKVLMPTVPSARERMLLEGQALAKLSHPNVVPIYDVGVIDEQVYLVMEWVRGQSLREHAAEARSVREVLAVYRQAGEGLAAAHRVGLIHRDFKPDNAIRGEDGRVRVLDFGLARGEAMGSGQAPRAGEDEGDPAGAVRSPDREHPPGEVAPRAPGEVAPRATRGAGTPRYMAPEQASGAALTAAADQFAFCTSLREALAQRRGRRGRRGPSWRSGAGEEQGRGGNSRAAIPRWLAALLARGTAENPARRFPDMAALLAALDRESTRRWRRRGLAAAALVAAVAVFALGKSRGGDAVDPCSGGAAELAAAWGPEARAAALAHLEGLGDHGREQAPRVGGELDAVAAGWVSAYRRACRAHRRDELPAELYQRRLGCLARTKVALGTAAQLLGDTRREGLDNALVAARSLPDATLCAGQDATQLAPPSAEVAPLLPDLAAEVEKARILSVALRPEAVAVAAAAVARAEATKYGPMIARANLAHGRAAAALARWGEAATALGRAVHVAVADGDDVVAVEAFARLVFVASRSGQPVDGASIIAPLAQRTAASGAFARALFYNNLATAELARANRAGARAWLLAAQQQIDAMRGEVDIELVSVAQNLALVADDPAERRRRASAVVELLSRALGANHGKTLMARVVEGNETADLEQALVRFADTCERYRRYQPHLATSIALCNYRLGWLADERGQRALASQAMARAAADPSSDRFQAEVAEQYLLAMPQAADVRDPDEPASGAEPAAAVSPRARAAAIAALLALVERGAADPQFWKRLIAVDAAIAAALALERSPASSSQSAAVATAAARRAWSRALEIGEPLDPPQMQRRLARIRAALARHLRASQPVRARRLAEEAMRWYRQAGGYDAVLSALEPLAR